MDRLALFGGPRSVSMSDADARLTEWPIVTELEREAVCRVLASGRFTSNNSGGGEVQQLEREWSESVGCTRCVALSSGTAAIELVLAAAGVEAGAEVIVPALSFIATAVAPVHRLAVPVFADIDPKTFNMDPTAVRAAITPRTQAIVAVHLHGLPCDMAELQELADVGGLLLLEDAAQAHTATYRGRRVGAIGNAAAFSLNAVKNLPTCGEGGLVTTDDADLARWIVQYRQFGEDLQGMKRRNYISHVLAGNAKMSAVQAAFTRSQLTRMWEYHKARDHNVREFLARLRPLPGLAPPVCPPDRTHAWHILRFRFDSAEMGHPDVVPGAMRSVLGAALRAEGVPVEPYQRMPLPGQPAFRYRDGFAGGYPWRLPGVVVPPYRVEDYPQALAVTEDSLTLQNGHLNPAARPVLQRWAEAFEKVWRRIDQLAEVARAADYRQQWRGVQEAAGAR